MNRLENISMVDTSGDNFIEKTKLFSSFMGENSNPNDLKPSYFCEAKPVMRIDI